MFETLHAQSRITTYDWSKYDGATAVFSPKMMTAEQLQEGTRQIGVNFYSTPKILRRFWTNRHHPLFYLATSFAWRHSNRVENRVPFLRSSGFWKNHCKSPVAEIEGWAEERLLAPADKRAERIALGDGAEIRGRALAARQEPGRLALEVVKHGPGQAPRAECGCQVPGARLQPVDRRSP